jgi:hypothetical protein
MADILSRSLRPRGDLLDVAIPAEPLPNPVAVNAAGDAQATRGLRATLSGISTGALASEALDAEIAGDTALAQEKYRQARIQQNNAAIAKPRITSLADINGFDDAADFVAGAIPQAVATTLPTIAGAVVGKGLFGPLGAYGGAAIPAYNMEADEAAADLAMDPEVRRNLTAEDVKLLSRTKGGVNMALEAAGPGYVINRLLGTPVRRTLRDTAQNVGAVSLGEAGTEAIQETVGNITGNVARGVDPMELDGQRILDAAATGAIGGGVMSGPQVAVDATVAGLDAIDQRRQAATTKATESATNLFDRIRDTSPEEISLTPPPEVATDADAAIRWMDETDGRTKEKVDSYINNVMSDEGAAPWKRRMAQNAADTLAQSTDPEDYKAVSTAIDGIEKVDAAATRLGKFADSASSFVKGVKDGNKTKSNEQLTAFEKLAVDELTKAAGPDLSATDQFQSAAPFLVTALTSNKYQTPLRRQAARELMELYGDQAVDVASRIGAIANKDNPEVTPERVVADFQSLLDDTLVRSKHARGVVVSNMTNEGRVALREAFGRDPSDREIDRLADTLSERAASGDTSADAQLDQIFGENRKRVDNYFKAVHEYDSQRSSPVAAAEDGNETEDDTDGFVERQAAKAMQEPTYASGTGGNVTMFDNQYKKAIDERVAKERERDPNMQVDVIPAEQYAKETGQEVTDDMKGKSVIRFVPGTDNNESTVLTRRDVLNIAGDREVVRESRMAKKEEGWTQFKSGDATMMRRTARASDGVVHFEGNDGKVFSVPATKLAYSMRGRLQKASGDPSRLEALSSAVSSILTHADMKRAYVINSKGEEVPLDNESIKELKFGSTTVPEQAKKESGEVAARDKRYRGAQYRAAKEKLDEVGATNVEARLLATATAAKGTPREKDAMADLRSFRKNPVRWLMDREQMRDMTDREWSRAGDQEGKTDTDPFIDLVDSDLFQVQMREAELDAGAKDAEIETRRLAKSPTKKPKAETTDKLAAMEEATKKNEQGKNGYASDKDVSDARDYVTKTLGPQFKVLFEEELGGSGSWEQGDTENVIRIAVNAGPGVVSVAHHEAMHEFIDRLLTIGRTDVIDVLVRAADSPAVMKQLERLLEGEAKALKQVKTDPEERIAYMYQFWASGALTIGPNTESVFKKIAKFFRKVTGALATDQRAEAILAAFHDGKAAEVSAVGRAMSEIMDQGKVVGEVTDKMRPLFRKAYGIVMPSIDVLESSDNPHAQEMAKLFFTPTVNDGTDKFGYLNASRAKNAEFANRFAEAIADFSKAEVEEVRLVLTNKKKSGKPSIDKAADEVRAVLDSMYDYMVNDRGIRLNRKKDYFPRVWDFEKISENPEAFEQMLVTKYPDRVSPAVAKNIVRHMSSLHGVEQEGNVTENAENAGYSPFMQAMNSMKLSFVKDADAQEFLNKDMVEIVTGYIRQSTRRTEYIYRFGERGEGLTDKLNEAYEFEYKKELASGKSKEEASKAAFERQAQFGKAVQAMEGTLGHDKIGPGWRKFNSWMIVYQNLRLLPLQLFSSMIDPLGLMVRGGSADDSFKAFKRGMREVLSTWTGNEFRDEGTKLAELMGTIERQALLDSLGFTQESIYMTRRARKISDTFFRYNGMEGWNRAMRTQATVAAVEFLKANTEKPGPDSERWFTELGLTPADVKLDANGDVVLTRAGFQAAGMSEREAAKAADRMQLAVNQWVDGAMLRPNAALRPSWSSDPRFGLIFYLKQFVYAFHKTFISRVRSEYMHGNVAPMVAMMPFVPTMIAADVLRGIIQTGGDLPQYMKGWGPGDFLAHGVQRAGLLGIGQLGVDEISHPADVFGPVVQQGIDVWTQPNEEVLRKATPGLALVK